jgi:hypothetical protein
MPSWVELFVTRGKQWTNVARSTAAINRERSRSLRIERSLLDLERMPFSLFSHAVQDFRIICDKRCRGSCK